MTQTSTGKALLTVGAIMGILLCVAIFAVMMIVPGIKRPAENSPASLSVASAPPPAAKDWNSTTSKIEAFVMSQEFMKRRLKAPGSADFPWYTDSEVFVLHRGAGLFRVNAYVDAQNSFGAKLRTRYICELKDEGKESWALISLKTR